jgi:RNA polymerase sigma-70 factor (ECF subfamily)
MASVGVPERRGRGEVRSLPVPWSDADLVRALRAGEPGAPAMLYDRYAERVRRVLARILGLDAELPDLLHESFAHALSSIGTLDDPERLSGWLTSIAVFTARGCIRRRKRQRWLRFFAPEELPEIATDPGHGARSTARAVYSVLARMPTDERIVLALRFVEGMELREVADACGISLATAKRRIARARERFEALAAHHPVLREWALEGGGEP